jgi:UPF0271 protein
MALSADELRATLHYQIAALDGMAAIAGLVLDYVKPHGALYNDMMADDAVREIVMAAVANYHRPLRLMLQATADARHIAGKPTSMAWGCGSKPSRIAVMTMTDACCRDASPVPCTIAMPCWHRCASSPPMRPVTTVSGTRLALEVDTLCVHGDNAAGVARYRRYPRAADTCLKISG